MIQGDLAELTAPQRAEYYQAVCHALGLNPLTKPFEYLLLNGKLRLYALRDCADQLRRLHGISVYIPSREKFADVYVVTTRAKDKTGREDESTGAVPLGTLKGDALANALMKAETKAKRRVTLSIAGLGWLDETELDTVKGVVTGAPDGPVAAIHEASLEEAPPPSGGKAPATPAGNGGPADIPEAVMAVLRSIAARVMGLYPGDKSDPTVMADRKNVLHAVFGVEVESGMAGMHTLAALGLDALREGLAKLDRLVNERPPQDAAADQTPVHPDIKATVELLASLQARATRTGATPENWEAWLEAHQIPRTPEGEPLLSSPERALLNSAFNEALASLKQAKAQAAKTPRRKAATGD